MENMNSLNRPVYY